MLIIRITAPIPRSNAARTMVRADGAACKSSTAARQYITAHSRLEWHTIRSDRIERAAPYYHVGTTLRRRQVTIQAVAESDEFSPKVGAMLMSSWMSRQGNPAKRHRIRTPSAPIQMSQNMFVDRNNIPGSYKAYPIVDMHQYRCLKM